MTHIAGHIQNSFLRIGKTFPKQGGILRPVLLQEDKSGKTMDYPIIFFNNRGIKLKYGQKIFFHPLFLPLDGTASGFVYAKNLITEKEYKIAHTKTIAPTKEMQAIIQSIEDQEKKYVASNSYKTIYKGASIAKASSLKGDKKVRSNDEVIQWIIDNGVPFDDMNLATN